MVVEERRQRPAEVGEIQRPVVVQRLVLVVRQVLPVQRGRRVVRQALLVEVFRLVFRVVLEEVQGLAGLVGLAVLLVETGVLDQPEQTAV
ncbi:MAG: hypothetical protein EBR27_13740 [Betaproteobacteria bacterium]|nr:hypothetical protein [Betaproteobacteria bacterium]